MGSQQYFMRKSCHQWDHNDIFWESSVIYTTYTQRYVCKWPILGPNNNIPIYRVHVCPGWPKESGKGSNPRLLGAPNNFHIASFLIWELLLWEKVTTEKKWEMGNGPIKVLLVLIYILSFTVCVCPSYSPTPCIPNNKFCTSVLTKLSNREIETFILMKN